MSTTINKNSRGDVEAIVPVIVTILVLVALAFFVAMGMWGCPQYDVYVQRKDGEGKLAHAQFSKEVAVAEAKAKMESASLLADAEIARARGVAQANQIIGESLKGNESYLRYPWIQGLESNNPTVIYVPTEANLPILEAGRVNAIHVEKP